MVFWEFLGDEYDRYEAAYYACCSVPPEDDEIFLELSRYSSLEILEAIRNGDARLYNEIVDSLNEKRAEYIIEIEEDEEET